jgi:hypothetical protein
MNDRFAPRGMEILHDKDEATRQIQVVIFAPLI